jgi:TIR domain
MSGDHFDFFISRADADAEVAIEIFHLLRASGYDVRIQDEDFPNGSNFIAGMSSLLEGAGGLVIILSEAYKQSRFCREEWTNFLAARSGGPDQRKVLIFRVEPCEPPGILSARVYSDLFGIAEPSRRQEIVLSAAQGSGVPAWARQSAADLLWARVSESCRHHVEAIRGRYEQASDTYYVERQFEAEVDSFIQSDRSASVIVGQSGMGKTTMVVSLLSKYHARDAVDVTRGLIDLVSPLSLIAYLFYTEKRRLLQNVISLMLLIAGEAEGEERSEKELEVARNFLLRLRIREPAALRLIRPLTKALSLQLRGILGKLKNPVKLSMLEQFFANQAQNCKDFEGVISIFSQTTCSAELRALVKSLAQSENSIILEFLTLALSAFYERQAALDAGAECLSLLKELFEEEGATATDQYCASLALYHINYFGEHASRQTMELMGQMASRILRERKGVFTLGKEHHNFNIIGTYGRALHRSGHLLEDGLAGGRRALHFAIEALEQAKEARDFKYYLYICENVGLLGVLIEPAQVFSVFTEILSDVKEISTEGQSRELVVFSPQQIGVARNQVLKSLANIRVLYRQEVDKYLLEELEAPALYAEVANRLTAEFSLETFYSWTFEQLTFRVLTRYRDQIGKKVLNAFREGMYSGSVGACLEIIVSRVLDRLGEISA